MEHTRKEKKRLVFITLAILALLISLVGSVYKDWTAIFDNNKKITELRYAYQALLDDEEKLESEATRLQDPDYIERYAKEKYLFSGEGEKIIRMD